MYTFSGVFFILFIWYFLKTECFTGRNLTLPARVMFHKPTGRKHARGLCPQELLYKIPLMRVLNARRGTVGGGEMPHALPHALCT
jgi:hypothetical protein